MNHNEMTTVAIAAKNLSDYGQPIEELPFESGVITSVDGESMELADSSWIGTRGASVRAGQPYALWGRGFGFEVRGCAVGNKVLWYESESDHANRVASEALQREAVKRDKARADLSETRERIAALPESLRTRIRRLEDNNPDFWWRFMPYELFVCEEARLIADLLKTVESIDEFHGLPYEDQKSRVPFSDGHSGNTFGMACMLAKVLVSGDDDLVVEMHGALAPLVGCEEYGCHPHDSETAT